MVMQSTEHMWEETTSTKSTHAHESAEWNGNIASGRHSQPVLR